MSSLTHGIKWFSAIEVIAIIISIITPLYLTQYISPKELGVLSIVLLIYNGLNLLGRPAFGESRLQMNESQSSESKVNDSIFLINIVRAIVFIIIFNVISDLLESYYDYDFSYLIKLMIVVIIISSVRSPRMYLLGKELDYKKLAISESLPKVLNSVTSLVYAINTQSVESILYGMIVGTSMRVFLSYLFTPYCFKFQPSFRSLIPHLKFSFFVMVERIFTYFGNNLDKIFILLVGNLESLGLYQLGKTITYKPVTVVSNFCVSILYPYTSRIKREYTSSVSPIQLRILRLLCVSAIIGLIIFLFSIPNLKYIFNVKWHESFKYSYILCLAATLHFFNSTFMKGVLKGFGNVLIFSKLQLLKSLLLLIVMYLFSEKYGAISLAYGLVIFEILVTILMVFSVKSMSKWVFFLLTVILTIFIFKPMQESNLWVMSPFYFVGLIVLIPTFNSDFKWVLKNEHQ